MNELINTLIVTINNVGGGFCHFAGIMFIQSSVLILVLLIIDHLMRKRVRAVFRYWIWMLVFIKLVLPPTLSLPTGIGNWLGDYFSPGSIVTQQQSDFIQGEALNEPVPVESANSVVMPQIQPSVPEFASKSIAPAASEALATTTPIETSAPAVSAVPSLDALSWQGIVFLLWLVGVLVITLLLIQRIVFVKGLVAQSEPAKNRLVDILENCLQQVGVRRNIRLRLSPNVTSPAVCGLFNPVILIPKTLLEKLSQEKLRAVLIHELAHIKRGDLWINCIQTFLQIAYFYNPLVWLTNLIVRRIREQAVDEMVLVALGAEAKSYSNTLIDIAEMAFSRPALSLRLVGVVESKKALSERIKHILSRPIPKNARLGILSLMTIIVIATVLLPMAKATEKKNAADDKSAPKQFIATLPNGVTIELVGVCEHPSEGKQWWKPDGILLSQAPYYTTGSKSTDEKQGYVYYEFALKLSDPDSTSYYWMIPGSGHGSDTGSPKDESGHQIQSLKAYASNLPQEQKNTTVRIGVTAAQWKTIVTYKPQDHEETYSKGGFDIAFGAAYSKDNRTYLPLVHNYNRKERQYAIRVVAITKSGQVRRSGYSGSGGNTLSSLTYIFNGLPLEEIKEFQFQIRPYQWVMFKNVSLRPGLKTDVQIEAEGTDIQAEKKSSRTKTVFLPDVDSKAQMLDLASGELVDVPKADTDEETWSAIEKMGKGDLVYDASSVILVRGATTQSPTETIIGQFKAIKIEQKLPIVLTVMTKEGVQYSVKVLSSDNNGCRLEYYPLPGATVPATMVGTWFFDNPMGDDEQMAIFPDGRVVVLYSNSHKDQTRYENGSIVLAEYKNARFGLALLNDTTLIESPESSGGGLVKRWQRIDTQPQTKLLRSLTGQNNSQTNTSAGMTSQADEQLLKQLNEMTQERIRAFNNKDIDKLLSYFADDAIILPDQYEIVIGKGSVRNFYLEATKNNVKINSVESLDQELWLCGDFIFGAGKIKVSFTTPTMPYQLSEWQNYVTVLTKQPNNSLKIVLDSSSPAPIPEDGNVPEPAKPVVINVTSSTKPADDKMEAVYGQIRQYESTFHKAFIDRSVETATEFYADNAILMPWRQNTLKGKKEITDFITKDMAKSSLVTMTQNALHVEGNDRMLYVVNLFTWTFKDASSGQDVTFTGKGVHIWMRQKDGSWKILLDLNNVNTPINTN